MSKKPSDRQKAANAMARLRRDSSPLTGNRSPTHPLSRVELLAGGEFVGWDARIDAQIRLSALPIDELSPRCRQAVQAAIGDPVAKRLRRARAALFAESAAEATDPEIARECGRVDEMLAFNLAALGCRHASAEIAAAALARWSYSFATGLHAEAYLCLRTAVLWAGEAWYDSVDTPYRPEPQYARLTQLDLDPARMTEFAQAVSDSAAQLNAADDVLRGGAGQTVPPDDDLALDLDDLEAGTPAPADDSPEPTAGRTLVVVPSLGHLPKPSTYTRERRDSPRAEFDKIECKPLPLRPAPDPHSFVEEGAAVAPWLRPVFEVLAQDLVGAPYAWLRPTVLVSPPGTGKTATVRAVARLLGLPMRLYSAAGASDGSFGGTSRQWGTGRASVPLQAILQEEAGNVCIGIDEIEKVSLERRKGSLADTLLPFLERENARSLFDLYIETGVDLSAVTYLATANSVAGIPEPLRDRLRIVEVPSPGPEHLPVVAANLIAEIRGERGLDAAWLPDLDGEEIELVGRHWKGGSLRPLRRLVETVLAGRDRLAPRH